MLNDYVRTVNGQAKQCTLEGWWSMCCLTLSAQQGTNTCYGWDRVRVRDIYWHACAACSHECLCRDVLDSCLFLCWSCSQSQQAMPRFTLPSALRWADLLPSFLSPPLCPLSKSAGLLLCFSLPLALAVSLLRTGDLLLRHPLCTGA